MVYYEAVQKAMGIESPLQEHYEWKCQSGDILILVINACEIGYGREEDLGAMEKAHIRLRGRWVKAAEPGEVVEQFRELQAATERVRSRLEPNLVSQLIYRGQCGRCP